MREHRTNRILLCLTVFVAACTATPGTETPSPEQIREMTDGGRNEEAAEAARLLLADVEANQGERSLAAAEALELLARALARAHHGDESGKAERLALARRALAIRTEHGTEAGPSIAWSYYVVGLVHGLVWDSASALELFEKALQLAEAHYGSGDPGTEVYVREYGAALYEVGRYEDALRQFERYRMISVGLHGAGNPATLPAFYNLALAHEVLGNLEESDRALQAAETILTSQSPVNARNLAWVGGLRGSLLALQGRLVESLRKFQETLGVIKERLGPDAPEVIRLRNYIGRTLIDLGDYEQARRVLSARGGIDDLEALVALSIQVNLGRAHHALGDVDAARSSYEGFERDAPDVLGPDHPLWGEFHGEYASLLLDLGDYAAARSHLERALAFHREGETTLHYAEVLARMGSLDLAQGQPARARERLELAMQITESVAGSNHRYHEIHEDLSETLFVLGEVPTAFDTAVRAANAAHDFDRSTIAVLPERQALARASRSNVAQDIASTIAMSGEDVPDVWRREAFEVLIRSRAAVFDEVASRRQRWVDAGDPELLELVTEWVDARTRVANLFMMGPRGDVGQYVARLNVAREEVERLEAELAGVGSEHRLLLHRNVDQAALLGALGPGETLVSYLRFERKSTARRERRTHLAAVVLNPGASAPRWIDLGPAAPIDEAIARWRASFEPASVASGGAPANREIAGVLRRHLWDPIASHVADARTVLIVPDATVNLVSFGALPSGDDRFLLEDGPAFHYLTAERDLLVAGREARTGKGLLIVGDPAFDGRPGHSLAADGVYRGATSVCSSFRAQRFSALPGTRMEARTVRDLWSEGIDEPLEELTGYDATEAAFKREAVGRRVLHLATHGFFLGEECVETGSEYRGIGGLSPLRPHRQLEPSSIFNPLLLSGLVLAGANHRENGATGDDGVLTAEEVGTLDLRGVELAVLSACRTGAGSVTEGEGLFGLRRAFLLAGAQTVVTNLWDVEDRTARLWIERLYRERFLEGRSMPDAMRTASLSVLEARRAAGLDTHPFYWAGWIAVGGR